MRKILFKARRKSDNKWIYGYLIELGKESFSDEPRFGIRNKAIPIMGNSVSYNLYIDEVFPETICQYTGLNDIDGRKIFEHDIINRFTTTEYKEEVKFNEGEFIICEIGDDNGPPLYTYLKSTKILGNVFDIK